MKQCLSLFTEQPVNILTSYLQHSLRFTCHNSFFTLISELLYNISSPKSNSKPSNNNFKWNTWLTGHINLFLYLLEQWRFFIKHISDIVLNSLCFRNCSTRFKHSYSIAVNETSHFYYCSGNDISSSANQPKRVTQYILQKQT